ncbi:HEPN domain-containing protein [Candidatus Woesearchaeota archaeon]|nr:HEPN domain-containing protein [Candidatus Woesearchaeota archaeon]
MISEERIKEANLNFSLYLSEGLLKKSTNKIGLKILIKNSHDSLKAASLLLFNNIYLWTIVSSYYSMFYIANAVFLELGYKTGDKIIHKVTSDALLVVVRSKLKDKLLEDYEDVAQEALAKIKSDDLIESFDYERRKRSFVQYETSEEDIKSKALTSFLRAKEFLFEMEKLIS